MVVVLMGTGALLILRAFKHMQEIDPTGAALEHALFGIQQQAAVVAALAGLVFTLVYALKTGKVATSAFAGAVSNGTVTVPASVPGAVTRAGTPTVFGTVAKTTT